MQCFWPTSFCYSPRPQTRHSRWPSKLFDLPAGHKWQVLPHLLSCYSFLGHLVHCFAADNDANYPGTQHGHSAFVEPVSLFACPGLHSIHDVWHSLGWIVPGRHLSHDFFLAGLLEAVPAAQHVVLHAQCFEVYVPAGALLTLLLNLKLQGLPI